jgi:hypothetical protein
MLNAYGVSVLVKVYSSCTPESIARLTFNLCTRWTRVTSILPHRFTSAMSAPPPGYPLNRCVDEPLWTLWPTGNSLLMPGVKPARSQVTLMSTLSCLPANSLTYIKLNILIFLITSHSPSTHLRASTTKRYRLQNISNHSQFITSYSPHQSI